MDVGLTRARHLERWVRRQVEMAVLVSIVLGMVSAYADQPTETLLPSGRTFRLEVTNEQLFMRSPPNSQIDPSVSDVTVHVQDAKGQPVTGIAVDFSVTVDGQPGATITPDRAFTQQGMAQARFAPGDIGVYQVIAQVEQKSLQVEVFVNDRSACCQCQMWPIGQECAPFAP